MVTVTFRELALAGAALALLLVAVVLAVALYYAHREASRFVEFVRSGRPKPGPHVPARLPGAEAAGVKPPVVGAPSGVSIEQQAAERALERVVGRGADELMSVEPGLTRAQAVDKARRILEETGAFNVSGGIPSA